MGLFQKLRLKEKGLKPIYALLVGYSDQYWDTKRKNHPTSSSRTHCYVHRVLSRRCGFILKRHHRVYLATQDEGDPLDLSPYPKVSI